MEKKLTDEELAEAAKFTDDELDFINDQSENAFMGESRPIVLMAICSSIIGNIVAQSEGKLSKELVVDLVAKGIEEYD